jgi:hypothetical protein
MARARWHGPDGPHKPCSGVPFHRAAAHGSRGPRGARERSSGHGCETGSFRGPSSMELHPPPHLLLPTPSSFAFQPSRPSLRVIPGPTPQALGVRVSTSCRLDPKSLQTMCVSGWGRALRAWVRTKHSPTVADHDVSPSCFARALDACRCLGIAALHPCTWTLRHWSQRHLASPLEPATSRFALEDALGRQADLRPSASSGTRAQATEPGHPTVATTPAPPIAPSSVLARRRAHERERVRSQTFAR